MAKEKGHYTQHPCVYIDDYGEPHLNVFRDFFCDTKLPKYQKTEENSKFSSYNRSDSAEPDTTDDSGRSFRSHHETSPYQYERGVTESLRENGGRRNLFRRIASMIFRRTGVDETFTGIKKSLRLPTTEDLELAMKSARNLVKLLHESGQYSQEDRVKEYIDVLSCEMVLMKNGYDRYLTEKDVLDTFLKCDRGISIVFLKYYNDLLPLDVAKKKIDVDRLLVFDNYVIMYYDDRADPFMFIREDSEWKKSHDPILFGMIEHSNKLYYICDWVYKDDDLTLDKLESILGRKSSNLADSSIGDSSITISRFNESLVMINEIEYSKRVPDTRDPEITVPTEDTSQGK